VDFQDITKKIEQLKAKKNRAEGRLEKQRSELKEKFGFESLVKAEKGLADLQAKRDELAEKLASETEAFLEKWGDRL